MAVSLVRSSIHGTVNTATTISIDCTGGNLLVVKVFYDGSSGADHAAPTIGGVAMQLAGRHDTWQAHGHAYYAIDPAQSTVVIDLPANETTQRVVVAEVFSGVDIAEPVVGFTNSTSTSDDLVTEFPLSLSGLTTDDRANLSAFLVRSTNLTGVWTTPTNAVEHLGDAQSSHNKGSIFCALGDETTGAATFTYLWNGSSTIARSAIGFVIKGTPSGPQIGLSTDLQPGASFTINYSNYDAIPVSPVTITDSNNNSITVAVTISDTVDGGKHSGTATGTFPALPSSGTATGLLFGNVTVGLNT